jgi:hypothetical protein
MPSQEGAPFSPGALGCGKLHARWIKEKKWASKYLKSVGAVGLSKKCE